MPSKKTLRFNVNGAGTNKKKDDWYNGIINDSISDKYHTHAKNLSKLKNKAIQDYFNYHVQTINTSNDFNALRIALLRKIDKDIDSTTALNFDKIIKEKIETDKEINNKFNVKFTGRGDKRKAEKDIDIEKHKAALIEDEIIIEEEEKEEEMNVEEKDPNRPSILDEEEKDNTPKETENIADMDIDEKSDMINEPPKRRKNDLPNEMIDTILSYQRTDDWYNNKESDTIKKKVEEHKKRLKLLTAEKSVKNYFEHHVQNVKTNDDFNALRVAVLRRIEYIKDKETAINVDKYIDKKYMDKGQEKETKKKKKLSMHNDEDVEKSYKEYAPYKDPDSRIVNDEDIQESDEIVDIEKDDENDEITQIEEELKKDDEIVEENKNKMNIDTPIEKRKAENEIDDIYHTEINDIPHEQVVMVDDPVVEIPIQDPENLPDDITPPGEQDNVSTEVILPDDFNQQQDKVIQQQEQEQLEEDFDINELEESNSTSWTGFDNDEHPITIEYTCTNTEVQDLFLTTLEHVSQEYKDINIETIDDLVSREIIPPYHEQDVQPLQEQDVEMTQPPIEENAAMENVEPVERNVPDIEMKEPTKQMLKQQEMNRKKQDQLDLKAKKAQQQEEQKAQEISDLIQGKKDEPTKMITDDYEKSLDEKRIKELQKISNFNVQHREALDNYLKNTVMKKVLDLTRAKHSAISSIRNGQVLSDFYLNASNYTKNKQQSDILNETNTQIKKEHDLAERYIKEKLLRRQSDILAEVADFTALNMKRIQANLDPKFAISKYIYPSFRDPDTFNIVKYASDPDGNVIINKNTGQPIIQSISAVDRNDSKRLLEQKAAVDATDTPSPYFPIYGKQARRFFSKLEYNYLGRMFQGPSGKARSSMPKPNNMPKEIQKLLNEMGQSLEIKEYSIDKKRLFKQWSELQVLKNSYQRYNQYTDYNYNQDKKELGQDGTLVDPDATESAAKLLQNITVQKLLDLLSQQKQQELALTKPPPSRDIPSNINASLKDKQQQQGAAPDNIYDEPIQPTDVAEIPEEETKQGDWEKDTNLNKWVEKATSSFNLPTDKLYKQSIFPAFGGDVQGKIKVD